MWSRFTDRSPDFLHYALQRLLLPPATPIVVAHRSRRAQLVFATKKALASIIIRPKTILLTTQSQNALQVAVDCQNSYIIYL